MRKRPRHSVKIVGRDWSLILPAGPGYDREVLLDHLYEAVQRHGNAELVSPNGRFAVASTATGKAGAKCSSCRATASRITGTSGGDVICSRCLLKRLLGRVRRQPQLAPARC